MFKERYVAKGYSQTEGIDHHETLAPTANITSVRLLMQVTVQHDLTVHQMDVKTAHLHTPIDEGILLEQPEGFEEILETGEKLVYKLKKYLYGLKQSGRNCVYRKQVKNNIIVLIWVDDLIRAGSINELLDSFKETI